MTAHTVAILFQTDEFFAAKLDNDGVRFGLRGRVSVDLLPDHALYDLVANSSPANADDVFDTLVEAGEIPLNVL